MLHPAEALNARAPGLSLVILVCVAAAIVTTRLAVAPSRTAISPAISEWREPITGMEFVLVPAGSFDRGSPPDEPERNAEEILHSVSLTRSFFLSRHEVTQQTWSTVMDHNPSHFGDCGARCPVENVSYADALEFVGRLGARSQGPYGGYRFRLPTEAEWEYACRAGGDQPFGRHGALTARDANINGNFPYRGPQGVFRRSPTEVGRFPGNPLGLYDMAGNVREWVQDSHCPYPAGPVEDPLGSCEAGRRVVRGGSWALGAADARCAARDAEAPAHRDYTLGLRLVWDP